MKSKQLGYLGIGNRRSLNVVQRPFSPLDLFATGEQGVWYDPSDLTTLFQDSAGTTPVTAVEQPVGLMLDKSKGLVLGSQLVVNGDGTTLTGWTPANDAGCTTAVSGGQFVLTTTANNAARLRRSFSVTPGSFYQVSFFAQANNTAGAVLIWDTNFGIGSIYTGPSTPNGVTTVYVRATTSTFYLQLQAFNSATGITAFFDNISVREIAGNHASQSTSASRPTLAARYNLLTYSEQFNDAAWVKSNSTVSANSTTAPDGTATADKVEETATTGQHLVTQSVAVVAAFSYSMSVYVKAAERSILRVAEPQSNSAINVDLSSGSILSSSVVTNPQITAVGNGWYRVSGTFNSVGATSAITVYPLVGGTSSYLGVAGSGFFVWGAQLIVTNDLTSNAYQRIAAATDYDSDATKFPWYLRFDGSDDSLATSSIDFSGTNKLSIFSALRRLSDSAQGMVLELSATTASNNGTFSLETPSTASGSDFQFISKGTVANTINADDYPNPYSAIITAQSAISTPLSNIRINGLEVDSDAGTQGTGNFGNFPLYVGRRNNASLPFNGRIYGLIVRGAETPEYLVKITESWLFGKSGITLDTTPDYTFVTLSNGDFVVDAYGNNVFIEVN